MTAEMLPAESIADNKGIPAQEEAAVDKYEIRLSVRELVEFILRSGDIDNRRGVSPEKAMQEGSRLHRMIQRSMGEGYSAEVPLHYVHEAQHYRIILDGRADGIIDESLQEADANVIGSSQISLNQYLINDEFPLITIDEIKCISRRLERLTEPVPVHLAQAKVYAYIYAKQNSLPLIRVRMTYCNIETEDLKYFFNEYTWSEIKEWFDALMEDYLKWAEFEWKWSLLRRDSLKKLVFPYEYRKGQKQLAAQVYRIISERHKLFMEAPTGTGKTLSTVFPSLKAMGENLVDKIFYLTARTITRTVAADTVDLLREQALRLKSITLTAKEKICPLEKAECNPDSCPYAKGHFDRVNEAIFRCINEYDRIDREVLAAEAEAYKVCPFELGLDISLFCDMIICDYNYVFDPHASLKRYFADGGSGGEYVFLVDEAHNLVERGRDMYSAELNKEDFLALKRTLNTVTEKYAEGEVPAKGKRKVKGISLLFKIIRGLERCNREMLAMKRECETYRVLDEVDKFAGLLSGLFTSVGQFLDEEENTGVREEVLEFYFKISHFLLIFEWLDDDYRIYTEHRADCGFWLKLLCVNPAKRLAECMAKGRASVLFSATLLPINYYKRLLGADNNDIAIYAESAFNKDRLGVYVCRDVTSRYKQRNVETFFKIARYIYEVTESRRGNYLVFFPSFSFMAEVAESFERHFLPAGGMECIKQTERMSEEERERFLARFAAGGLDEYGPYAADGEGKSLIGFCVLGGIFSEGIDLKEDALIGSIIIGVGFPQICNEREIIKEFFEENGYDYAYRFPGMNKVLQAAGRVIRTEKDRGVVALLDERFLDRSYQRMFPREWTGFSVTDLKRIGGALEAFWDE